MSNAPPPQAEVFEQWVLGEHCLEISTALLEEVVAGSGSAELCPALRGLSLLLTLMI